MKYLFLAFSAFYSATLLWAEMPQRILLSKEIYLATAPAPSRDSAVLPALPSAYDKLHLGLELEVSPFILRGYILQGWLSLGEAPFRLRINIAQNDIPRFLLDERIKREKVHSIGGYLDFFLRPQFTGFYFTGGIHYFAQDITTKDSLTSGNTLGNGAIAHNKFEVNSLMVTLGTGFNYFFYKGFYVAPWVGFHTRLTNTRERAITQEFIYSPKLMYPEVALKIGWHLGRGKKNPPANTSVL